MHVAQGTALRWSSAGSPVVHADETGWREDGINGYVWTFARRLTGTSCVAVGARRLCVGGGVLVSDAAYNHYPGQRCWAPAAGHPSTLRPGLSRWAQAVRQLYDPAVMPPERCPLSAVSPSQLMLESRLLSLCSPFSNDEIVSSQALSTYGTVHQGAVRLRLPP